MYRTKSYFLIFLSFIFFTCKKKINTEEFILKGNYNGTNSEYLFLQYKDRFNKKNIDTLFITDGQFNVKGYIDKVSYAVLYRKSSKSSQEDINYTQFFIKPGINIISVEENEFHKAIRPNSKTQEEYEKLEKLLESKSKELLSLRKYERQLVQKDTALSHSKFLEDEFFRINQKADSLLENILDEKLQFAKVYSNSFVSAYLVELYFSKISSESVKKYYENFSSEVKNSVYGKSLEKLIRTREASSIGDLAPNFSFKDIKGNDLELKSFRNKYVLLDFWASWCSPCIEDYPKLKHLYRDYHAKGFEIISISIDNKKLDWKKAIQDNEILRWKHTHIGPESSIRIKYNVSPIPDYILINPDGYIVGRTEVNKKFEIKDLEKKLSEIFAEF